jgi:hypothetical protein
MTVKEVVEKVDVKREVNVEPPAFTLGGYYHSVDCTVEVSWEELSNAEVNDEFTGNWESSHERGSDTATVVFKKENYVVVLFENTWSGNGENITNSSLECFSSRRGPKCPEA